VSLVHGSSTTGAPVHRGPASIADRRSSSELGLRALRSTMACRDYTGITREGKVSRERGGGGRWGASPFLVAEGGQGVVKAERR
jgi:hypothetical protein